MLDINAYLNSLPAPKGVVADMNAAARGRRMLIQNRVQRWIALRQQHNRIIAGEYGLHVDDKRGHGSTLIDVVATGAIGAQVIEIFADEHPNV